MLFDASLQCSGPMASESRNNHEMSVLRRGNWCKSPGGCYIYGDYLDDLIPFDTFMGKPIISKDMIQVSMIDRLIPRHRQYLILQAYVDPHMTIV